MRKSIKTLIAGEPRRPAMACATILIEVSGGVVTQVTAECNVKVILWDHDNDGAPGGEPGVGPGYIDAEVSTGTIKMIEDEIKTQVGPWGTRR